MDISAQELKNLLKGKLKIKLNTAWDDHLDKFKITVALKVGDDVISEDSIYMEGV